MITSDSHMHTRFSTDSKAKIQDMIESALEKGLESVCITDHVDNDYPFHEDTGEKAFQIDLDAYFPELERWQDAYAGKIRIRKGIELGLQPHLSETYQRLVSQYPFDFVIGSVHVVHGMDPYYGEIFEGRTDEDVYRETFAATLENLDAISTFGTSGLCGTLWETSGRRIFLQKVCGRNRCDPAKSDCHGQGDRTQYSRLEIWTFVLSSSSGNSLQI